jgi:hypothetical protein
VSACVLQPRICERESETAPPCYRGGGGGRVLTRPACYRCANNGCGNVAMDRDAARGVTGEYGPLRRQQLSQVGRQSLLKAKTGGLSPHGSVLSLTTRASLGLRLRP